MITRMRRWTRRTVARLRQSADDGMTTVEYAIGTVVAAALAVVYFPIRLSRR